MTREEAIEWIENIKEKYIRGGDEEFDEKRKTALDTAIQALEQEPKWISVSERLPEDNYAVLVWCPERKNNYCAYRAENQWWIFGAYSQKVSLDVIAWMPLPEPYKAESQREPMYYPQVDGITPTVVAESEET